MSGMRGFWHMAVLRHLKAIETADEAARDDLLVAHNGFRAAHVRFTEQLDAMQTELHAVAVVAAATKALAEATKVLAEGTNGRLREIERWRERVAGAKEAMRWVPTTASAVLGALLVAGAIKLLGL